jgi:polyisoprenyl-teichoic acid--peptidoglycan teichoic acid transferase
MSVQEAFLAPNPDYSPPPLTPLRMGRPTGVRRRSRFFMFGFLSFLLVLVLSVGILLFCPPVLSAMSAIFLSPQAGTVPWNGHDRITVVAMGLTQRTTEPARTDTLLVMGIDPANHQINMLSVPRDLWVDIPGYGQGKLAIAYAIGGPRLAAYTLEKNLGIPVDYTMALTFRGFTKIIDAMGGVTVDVPNELKDPLYPCLVGYDYCPIDIPRGTQHMNGATALEFVRERHAFAQQDLARVQDQQAFADAAKHTVLSPTTWLRYPAILQTLRDNLITNVPMNDFPVIAAQYLITPKSRVTHSYINIENGMVRADWSTDGQSILLPTDSTSIPNLVHRLYADPALAGENASVAVLNGTPSTGMATDVENTLQGMGFHTVLAGNADASNYQHTLVIENSAAPGAKDYTARRLQRVLGAQLLREHLSAQSAQIVVVAGSDLPAAP